MRNSVIRANCDLHKSLVVCEIVAVSTFTQLLIAAVLSAEQFREVLDFVAVE